MAEVKKWGFKHMKKVRSKKSLRLWALIMFLLVFLASNSCSHILILNRENEEKLKAQYTAEITLGRIEAQLNKYLSKTELMKQVLEYGTTISDEQFYTMAAFMEHERGALEGIGLASDGVLTQYYAADGTTDISGADFLKMMCIKRTRSCQKNQKHIQLSKCRGQKMRNPGCWY